MAPKSKKGAGDKGRGEAEEVEEPLQAVVSTRAMIAYTKQHYSKLIDFLIGFGRFIRNTICTIDT